MHAVYIVRHKGVNQRSKDVTQTRQQRPESPTVTLTWRASKYKKTYELHQRYILVSQDTCTPSGRVDYFCCTFAP